MTMPAHLQSGAEFPGRRVSARDRQAAIRFDSQYARASQGDERSKMTA
jgi:hypothetical protein